MDLGDEALIRMARESDLDELLDLWRVPKYRQQPLGDGAARARDQPQANETLSFILRINPWTLVNQSNLPRTPILINFS